MSLLQTPQFPTSKPFSAFIAGINVKWQALSDTRTTLQTEKQQLDTIPVDNPDNSFITRRRKNRDQLMDLDRKELALLRECSKWGERFISERDAYAAEASELYQRLESEEIAKLEAMGYEDADGTIPVKLPVKMKFIAAAHPRVREARTEAERNFRGMHPQPGVDQIQAMIAEREKTIRGAMELAAA